MVKLKNLLTEDPDGISVDNKMYMFDNTKYIKWVFSFYNDVIDNGLFYIAIDPVSHKIITDNKDAENEIKSLLSPSNPDKFSETNKTISLRKLPENYPNTVSNPFAILNGTVVASMYTHLGLRKILSALRRIKTFTRTETVTPISGRVFKIDDTYYITFWESNYEIKKDKLKIERMLNDMGISPYSTKWQFGSFGQERFITFDEAFSANVEADEDEMSLIKRTQAQLKANRELHAKKALLSKNIVQALQDKPQDMATLQARLEDKFGMPFAKIKAMYGNIPLDQLLARELKEVIKGFKKS